jgi:transglutaminase-like putative cysteine protease
MLLVSEFAPGKTRTRLLRVRHLTHYRYDRPIQHSSHHLHLRPMLHSSHHLHLRPMLDWKQRVLKHRLTITPEIPVVEYEDVFGNCAARFEITQPYTELVIHAESTVRLLDVDPFAFANLPIRLSFPLVWMPWQQKMLSPYLQPVELPDTQLQELYHYAFSFVKRHDGDLMETLFEMNQTLFKEYQYVPGSTWLETTPYEVFTSKRGVCQDFANLFICMARLLGIPARYVCGYVFTGNNGAARPRCDASHAWVQLYLPDIGWKAFEPTNGVLPRTDHIRVAYGRYYRDTAPTSGTLYNPAFETMNVDVEVLEENQSGKS